ncbi:hypothetical protein PPACK8108_LOCUS4712 [Phakopsora pachyrhizi]|uniref:Uncharacterized protein n=1 Tax=Phakopsora pachyrhizi TaxID=170000 RepID=A0AAV0ARE3_PHAPC|nr:hypothetical protein PPACK8108_LOCUS4712 [Phakopsora pachyrhizi]
MSQSGGEDDSISLISNHQPSSANYSNQLEFSHLFQQQQQQQQQNHHNQQSYSPLLTNSSQQGNEDKAESPFWCLKEVLLEWKWPIQKDLDQAAEETVTILRINIKKCVLFKSAVCFEEIYPGKILQPGILSSRALLKFLPMRGMDMDDSGRRGRQTGRWVFWRQKNCYCAAAEEGVKLCELSKFENFSI